MPLKPQALVGAPYLIARERSDDQNPHQLRLLTGPSRTGGLEPLASSPARAATVSADRRRRGQRVTMVKPTLGDFVLTFPAASRAANLAPYLPGFSAFVPIRPLNGTALTPRAPD